MASFYKNVPKNQEEVKENFERLKRVFESQYKDSASMWKTYQEAMVGNASQEDIKKANASAQEMLKLAGFSFAVALPGTIFILPAMIHFAKSIDVDIVPTAVKKEFDLKV
jgi:hypothetical protein